MINIKALASSSRGNAYYVTDGVAPLLIECGIPFKEIQKGIGFAVSKLAGCLVTHEHKDHSKAVKDIMKAGIDVYTSAGTIEMFSISGHRIKPVKAREKFMVGSWSILPFETQHDAREPLGFLLHSATGERLLYITDSYYVRYKFHGLNYIMIECNYADDILSENVQNGSVNPVMKRRIRRSHFSLANVKEFLKANDLSKVQEIWLIHLSDQNSDTDRFKKEVQQLTGKPVIIPEAREV